MSLVVKNGFEYADGGMGNVVPIFQAIHKGATDIDIILLKKMDNEDIHLPIRNALELTSRVFSFMLNQIVTDDLIIGRLEGLQKQVKLNFYYPDEELSSNSLIFDPVQMSKWWEDGYELGKRNNPECRLIGMPSPML